LAGGAVVALRSEPSGAASVNGTVSTLARWSPSPQDVAVSDDDSTADVTDAHETRSQSGLLQAQVLALASGSTILVENFGGLYESTDAGLRWQDISPSSVYAAGSVLSSHVIAMVARGSRVWLELVGDTRFGFIPYSWDAGKSWHTARLPQSAFLNGGMRFSTLNDGLVNGQLSDSRPAVFKTTDGGSTWSVEAIGRKLPLGPIAPGVPKYVAAPAGFQLRNVYRATGRLLWAQAWGRPIGEFTPTYLLRSDNDGRSWTTSAQLGRQPE
jgi:hypothetical protein